MQAKMRSLRTLVIGSAIVPALLVGPTAEAGKIGQRDRVGDAFKAVDVKRWKAKNGKKNLVITLRFRAPRYRKLYAFASGVRPKGKSARRAYLFGFRRAGKRGKFKPRVFRGMRKHNCKRLRFRKRGDRIRIRVPQKCLRKRDRGRVRFSFATATTGGRQGDTSRYTRLIRRG